MNGTQAGQLTDAGWAKRRPHFFRIWMPYLFQRLKVDGPKRVFLPLNRAYKPLGTLVSGQVEYGMLAPTHAVSFSRDLETFRDIWHNIDATHGRF